MRDKTRAMIVHVMQRDPNGCGIATAAMILDRTYDECRQYVIDKFGWKAGRGVAPVDMQIMLGDLARVPTVIGWDDPGTEKARQTCLYELRLPDSTEAATRRSYAILMRNLMHHKDPHWVVVEQGKVYDPEMPTPWDLPDQDHPRARYDVLFALIIHQMRQT